VQCVRRLQWAPMKVISLQSGSNGNSIYVEAAGVRLLFDAGISGRQARERLRQGEREISAVDALLISHDHSDHARGMGVFQRSFGLPIWVTEATLAAAQARCRLGKLTQVKHFTAGSEIRFGPVRVETIPTPHDGVDGVAFVVDDGVHRLGILTDLGHKFAGLQQLMQSLDAVVIESNFDPDMLEHGPYPDFLKQRIRGPAGHLSNHEAAELLTPCIGGRLRWACLAHLSAENNSQEVALQTHHLMNGQQLRLHVASRYEPTPVLDV